MEDSIQFDDVHIEPGAQVRNCIIDKGVRVPKQETVGVDPTKDESRFTVSENRVVVIPHGYHFTPTQIRPTAPQFLAGRRPHEQALIETS